MKEIVLYTTHCPRCEVLKEKLDSSGIKYTECTDIDTMQSLGLEHVPVLAVNGVLSDFSEAIKLINGGELV